MRGKNPLQQSSVSQFYNYYDIKKAFTPICPLYCSHLLARLHRSFTIIQPDGPDFVRSYNSREMNLQMDDASVKNWSVKWHTASESLSLQPNDDSTICCQKIRRAYKDTVTISEKNTSSLQYRYEIAAFYSNKYTNPASLQTSWQNRLKMIPKSCKRSSLKTRNSCKIKFSPLYLYTRKKPRHSSFFDLLD